MSYEVHAERKAWKAPLLKQYKTEAAEAGGGPTDENPAYLTS